VTGRRKLSEGLHNLYFSVKQFDNLLWTTVVLAEVLHGFSQSLHATVGTVPLLGHYRLPSKFFLIHHSPVILQSDDIQSRY
jgi:hypothetical protein